MRRKPPPKKQPRLWATSGGLVSWWLGPRALHPSCPLQCMLFAGDTAPLTPRGCHLAPTPSPWRSHCRAQGSRLEKGADLSPGDAAIRQDRHSPRAAHIADVLQSFPNHRPRQGLTGSFRLPHPHTRVTSQDPTNLTPGGRPHPPVPPHHQLMCLVSFCYKTCS